MGTCALCLLVQPLLIQIVSNSVKFIMVPVTNLPIFLWPSDIDECLEQNIDCGSNQMCFNMRGSYQCIDTPCPPNYQREPLSGYVLFAAPFRSCFPAYSKLKYLKFLLMIKSYLSLTDVNKAYSSKRQSIKTQDYQ